MVFLKSHSSVHIDALLEPTDWTLDSNKLASWPLTYYYYPIPRFSSCRAERKYAYNYVWFSQRFRQGFFL